MEYFTPSVGKTCWLSRWAASPEGLAVLHDGQESSLEVGPPGIAPLADVRVGQHIVQKQRLRQIVAPGHRVARGVGERDLVEDPLRVQGVQILGRHVLDQEGETVTLLGGNPLEG